MGKFKVVNSKNCNQIRNYFHKAEKKPKDAIKPIELSKEQSYRLDLLKQLDLDIG